MPGKTWQRFGDKIPDFLEPTPEEVVKAQELLGEDFPLFEKIRNGTSEEKLEARNALTMKNMRLVYRVVNRYYCLLEILPRDLALERNDLIQEGILGLMRAIETYDYTKGFRFSSYAFQWIRQFITRCYQDKALPVRVPVYLQKKLREIEEVTNSLRIELGREPIGEEIVEAVGIVSKELEELTNRARLFQHILSLDTPIKESKDQEEMSLYEVIAGNEESFEEALERKEISADFRKKIWKIFWLAGLDSREQYFLERFFGLDGGERETLEKIGDKQGLSRERVRQVIDKALGKIRTPELGKIAKASFPQYTIPEPIPSYPWRRAFKLLKFLVDFTRNGERYTPETLIKMTASFFGLKPEQLKNSVKKEETVEVARSIAILLLFKLNGLTKTQICSLFNIKESTIEASLAKVHEKLKIWGKEVLWAKLRFLKPELNLKTNDQQSSVILHLLDTTKASYSEIGNLLNVPKEMVENVARKAGINGVSRRQERELSKREKVLEEILNHPEMGYKEIGKLLGLHEMTINRIAWDMGVKRGRGSNKRRPSPELEARNQKIFITAQQNPNLTYDEIGALFNLSKLQIFRILHKNGYRRFLGWHQSRLDSHKVKPKTKQELWLRNQEILSVKQNNPELTCRQIGKMFGLSHVRISEIMRQAKQEFDNSSKKGKIKKSQKEEILSLLRESPQLSYHQIGKKFGLTDTGIRYIASEAGLAHIRAKKKR